MPILRRFRRVRRIVDMVNHKGAGGVGLRVQSYGVR